MSSSSSRPKSYKADGTPKKRWTAAERAAKGHKPRKSGGVRGRDQRDSRSDYGDSRRGRTDSRGRTFQSWSPDEQGQGRRERRDDWKRDGGRETWKRDGDRRDDWKRDGDRRENRRGDWNDRGRGQDRRRDDDRRQGRGGWNRDDDRRGGRQGARRWDRDDRRGGSDRNERRGGWDRNDRRGGWDREDDRRGGRDGDWNDRRRDRDDRRRGGRQEYNGANRHSQRDWDDRRHSRRSYGHDGSFDRDGYKKRDEYKKHDGYEEREASFDREGQDRKPWNRDGQDTRREHRDHADRFERHESRRDDREDRHDSFDDADQMEWHAEEITDLDVSTVDHEAGFSALGVPDRIVAALRSTGIESPFRIQIAAIPDAIAGRDVLGRASTGSGKTLAFGVPVLSRLASAERPDKRPRALIMSPTRELAMQIADVLSPLASSMDLSTILIAGGMSYGPQTKAFRKGVDLVVATPGRLVDLLETGDADLSGIEVAVLDEADHMADMGFMPAVSAILDAVPDQAQHLLFSATLDDAVDKLVKRYLHDPVTHEIDPEKGSVATATHHAFHVKPHEKVAMMCEIANRPGHTIVFARTQRGASRMAEQMREAGVMAGALHGGLTQGARARVLGAFKKGSLPVLVATDVAARGIDVDDVTLVLQVDPPMNSKDYLHRSGRTARAGHDGAVVSLVLPHQRREMTRIYHGAGVTPVQTTARLGEEAVATIAGCSPVPGEPIDQADYDVLVAPRPQKSRKSRHGGSYGQSNGHSNRPQRGGYRSGSYGHHGDGRGRRGDQHREDRQARYGRTGNQTW